MDTRIEAKGEHGCRCVESSEAAQAQWIQEIKDSYKGSLLATSQSWFTGYNSNVDGHDKLRYNIYLLGAPKYRERLTAVAENDYEGFEIR